MAKEERQVVVIPDENDNQKSYWSLVKYGKYTWKNKWWVLGTTVVFAVGGFLVTKFGINPSKAKNSSEFSLSLAIQTEKDKQGKVISERFLNGEQFNYTEIVSKENLQVVKTSSEEYSNINIDKMFEKGAISVSIKTIDEKTTSDNLTHYQLSANESYFKNKTQAQQFISDLINLQKVRNEIAINSFCVENYIVDNLGDYEFVHQIQNLESQYKAINTTYTNLTTSFPTSAVVGEGKTIQTEYTKFVNKFKLGSGTVISDLGGKLVSNGYVKYEAGHEAEKIEEVKAQSEAYKLSLKTNISAISSYKENLNSLISSAVITPDDNTYFKKVLELENSIETLQLENSSLLKSLKLNGYSNTDIDVTLLTPADVDAMDVLPASEKTGVLYHLSNPTENDWDKNCANFAEQISKTASELKSYRESTDEVFHSAYLNYQNQINYYTAGVVASSGGISSAIIAVLAAVVGLVASSLIATAIEISKEKEANK